MKSHKITDIEISCLPDSWELELIDKELSYLDNLVHQMILFHKKSLFSEMMLASSSNHIHDLKKFQLRQKDAVNLIKTFMKVRQSDNGSILITNVFDPILVTNDPSNITRVLQAILDYELVDVSFKIDDVVKCSKGVLNSLSHSNKIKPLNTLENYQILTSDYRIFDTKSKKYIDSIEIKDLDFIYKSSWTYLDQSYRDNLDSKEKSEFALHYETSKRIIDGWCCLADQVETLDDLSKFIDKDRRNLIMQIHVAAIQGNSRNKFIELLGDGGNGKSSLIDVLSHLVGKENTVDIDMSQFADDNMLGLINSNTRLIVSHEIPTDFRLTGNALKHYKSLAISANINIVEKFMNPRLIKFTGLGIQACNTEISFGEQSDSILDRRLFLRMSNLNFRHRDDLKLDLNHLMSNEEFRSVYATYIFDNCEDFIKFNISNDLKQEIEESTRKGDNLAYFLDEQFYKFNRIKILSTNMLYDSYYNWSKDTKIQPLTKKSFSSKIQSYLKQYGYQFTQHRTTFNSSKDSYEKMSYYQQLISNRSKSEQSTYAYKDEDYIDLNEIETFKNRLEQGDLENLSDSERIILTWLSFKGDESTSSLAKIYLQTEGVS